MAQDAENHIFPVAFYVVDKECDASYEYFFQNMRSFADDTEELCINSDSIQVFERWFRESTLHLIMVVA